MLLTIAIVFALLWALGIVTAYTLGGYIPVLLVVTVGLLLGGTFHAGMSDLLNGRLAGFSMERVIRFLVALDPDIQIIVRQKPRSRAWARFSVAQVPPHLVRKDEARVSGAAGSGR
jgi:hypothetical protein